MLFTYPNTYPTPFLNNKNKKTLKKRGFKGGPTCPH